MYADDACIVSRSPRGLVKRMRVIPVGVFVAFGLTDRYLREQDGDHVDADSACTSNADIVFNATGQQYHQTTSVAYLGGAVTETPNL